MYRITIKPDRSLVEVRLGGLISTDEFASYITELKRQFIAYKLRSYAMIIDVTDCPIQAQDTMRAMVDNMAAMPKARALAIVTGGSLARMQIRRLFTQSYARIVHTIEEGRAWAIDGIEPVKSA